MNIDSLIKQFRNKRVKVNEPLAPHVNMKVGGLADYFFKANDSGELEKVVVVAIEEEIPFVVIGNGANVLVSDKGVRGLVIKNSSERIKFRPHGFVEVDSGVDNTLLIREAKNRGLVGLERLLKVPGTLGGAVYMNAGDTGRKRFFGDLVVSVDVIDREGKVKTLSKEDCDFGYRTSRFQKTSEIVLRTKIKLQPATSTEIDREVQDILQRKGHQPAGSTVGSTFKNPDYDYAGRLIEECGLKGKKIGGAKISEKHANFIINEGDATASDVRALIELMKKSVKEKFNVKLEEEVRYLGEW